MPALTKLNALNQSLFYWILVIFSSAALLGGALYYQYALDFEPCVLCIHVRLWVCAFLLIGLIGLWVRLNRVSLIVANLLSVISAIGFLERSYETLATERGWSESSCGINAGLPSWFDLERWLPALFEVRDSCGFTPYVIGTISMAEILVATGILVFIATIVMTLTSVLKIFNQH